MRPPSISVIIPTRNEEESITGVINEVRACLPYGEVIVVDSSSDHTAQIASGLGANVFRSPGKGKGAAVTIGVSKAHSENIVVMDGDGSHIPQEVALAKRALEGGASIAKGSRFLPGGGTDDMTVVRKVGNLFLVKLLRLCGFRITDLCYGYVGFKASLWRSVAPLTNSLAYDVNLVVKGLFFAKGRVVEFPSHERKRYAGGAKSNTVLTGMDVVLSIAEALRTLPQIRQPKPVARQLSWVAA
jgi:glycosyltransferase involved in cell wall biosynthesis